MATPERSVRLAKRQEIEDRRDKVMALARAGASTREIGKKLGVSAVTVSRDWRTRIEEHAKTCEDTGRLRTAEIDRIDTLMTAWWGAALQDLAALREVRALIELRAKFLGLEAPREHRVRGQVEVRQQSVELHLHYVGGNPPGDDSSS